MLFDEVRGLSILGVPAVEAGSDAEVFAHVVLKAGAVRVIGIVIVLVRRDLLTELRCRHRVGGVCRTGSLRQHCYAHGCRRQDSE